MYRECDNCTDKTIEVNRENEEKQTTWNKWKTRRIEKERKTETGDITTVQVSMTAKDEESGTMGQLIDDFQEDLKKTSKHFYNIKHQYISLKNLKENVKYNKNHFTLRFLGKL